MGPKFGGAPKCPVCQKSVYAAEKAIGPGSQDYHKMCLVCVNCKKMVDSTTLCENDSKVSVSKQFIFNNAGPKVFGYSGGGVLSASGGTQTTAQAQNNENNN
eukprot:gene7696-9467_t